MEKFEKNLLKSQENSDPIFAIPLDKRQFAFKTLKKFFVNHLAYFSKDIPQNSHLFSVLISSKLFNYPLEAILMRDEMDDTPKIISQFYLLILQNPVENIFKLVPNRVLVEEFKSLLNSGSNTKTAQLENDIHLVGFLLLECNFKPSLKKEFFKKVFQKQKKNSFERITKPTVRPRKSTSNFRYF